MTVSTLNALDAAAIEWLLESDEPGVALQTRRDILDEAAKALRVLRAAGA